MFTATVKKNHSVFFANKSLFQTLNRSNATTEPLRYGKLPVNSMVYPAMSKVRTEFFSRLFYKWNVLFFGGCRSSRVALLSNPGPFCQTCSESEVWISEVSLPRINRRNAHNRLNKDSIKTHSKKRQPTLKTMEIFKKSLRKILS